MSLSIPMLALGFAIGVTLVGAIFGIGPRWREVSWAIEDSAAWIVERVPFPILVAAIWFPFAIVVFLLVAWIVL